MNETRDGRQAAKADMLPGGIITDEGHRKLARLQESLDKQAGKGADAKQKSRNQEFRRETT